MDRPTHRKIACLLGCPDEDDQARLCIAYDGDELAACDVRSMRDALARHGFEPNVVPRHLQRRGEVFDHLVKLAVDEKPGEFLFFFSGHGRYRRGKLELVLGPNQGLPAADLLEVLEDCKALTKLAILDCCFAGAIEADLIRALDWPEQRNDLRLLLAANEGQRALHDPTQGSYFSRFICEALTDWTLWEPGSRHSFVDAHGDIGSHELVAWLRTRTDGLAKDLGLSAVQIPRPLALPRDPEGFRVLRLNLDRPLGYPEHLQAELRGAIAASATASDAAAASYAWCVARQSGTSLPESETLNGNTGIIDALLQPKAFYLDSDELKLPLISFLAHLKQGLVDGNAVDHWLRAALSWLYQSASLKMEHINDALRVDGALPAAASQRQRPPCLLIEVAPANPPLSGYQVSWDWIDAKGETRHKADRGAPVGHAGLPVAIAERLSTAFGVSRGARIELVLPAKLLADDDLIDRLERLPCWDAVTAAPDAALQPGQLAHERPFLLRCWERWGSTDIDAGRYGGWRLRQHWQDRSGCLSQSPSKPCLDWIGSANAAAEAEARLIAPRLEQRPLALGLVGAIAADQFDRLLRTGAPILLWPRCNSPTTPEATALKKDLKTRCGEPGLAALPRALYEHRRYRASTAGACGGTYALSLLWDTPDLLKYDQPPDDPDLMFEAHP